MSADESSFTLQIRLDGDVGMLEWDGVANAEALAKAISMAADDQLVMGEVRRLEAHVASGDMMARHALQGSGFRLEGIRRQALEIRPGEYADVHLYARLATDIVHGPNGFSGVMNSVLPTKRVIAHVVFRNEQDQLLLLRTSYKDDLELPGGVVEPDEPPRVGAEREVAEELGLDVSLGAPLLVDWMPASLGWSDAIEFLFDGGVLADDIILSVDGREITEVCWLSPHELTSHVSPLSARRLAVLLAGGTTFAEDGVGLA